jgi:hypothetical protein
MLTVTFPSPFPSPTPTPHPHLPPHPPPTPSANPTDVHAQVSSLLKHSGLRESLRTLTVNTAQQAPLVMRSHPLFGLKFAHSSADEPVECIRLARLHWERGINEELMAIASELKRPFLRMRCDPKTPTLYL